MNSSNIRYLKKLVCTSEFNFYQFVYFIFSAESFCTKAFVVKGLRRHAKGRTGEIRYTFCHYFVRLEEGKPPKDYYKLGHKNADELLEDWKLHMRNRKISNTL